MQANVGEVIAWRNLFWALSDAMVRDPRPWIGDYLLPNMDPQHAIIATILFEDQVHHRADRGIGLIYLNSHASDFKNPEIRPYLDPLPARLPAATRPTSASSCSSCCGIAWPPSSVAGTLYEINYGGSTEEIRRCLFGAQASGNADRFKGFAEECMAEYDLDGWKVPDLTDPGELSYHVMRGAGR